MSKQLSKEDYEILNQKQPQFEMLINSQYLSYLDGPWVGELGRIFKDHFNETFKASCPACLISAMTKIYKKMEEYRANNTPA